MENFNPNLIGIANGNYFALPVETCDAELVLLQAPWDATVSYGQGTAQGPEAIMDASLQVDLFDSSLENAWEMKMATKLAPEYIQAENVEARKMVEHVIAELENGEDPKSLEAICEQVNQSSQKINDYIYQESKSLLDEGKMVAVVGGEHSVPFGLIKALSEKYDSFGILHIDAHADLRDAYEGFQYSHASIMNNVLEQVKQVTALTQVAIRDYCEQENEIMQNDLRVRSFTDKEIKDELYNGKCWREICDQIISTLPENVYVSFDIDGLSPEYCPNTGTPVPGGMDFSQADYLLSRLAASGRRIIGFDLCEVAPSPESEWDANVGARMLFKLAVCTNISNSK